MSTPFQLAALSDELGQDFDRACAVAAELGMEGLELRELWNKNLFQLDAAEVAAARRLLDQRGLRVSGIASPLFKVDWPEAPRSALSPPRDEFRASFSFEQQDEVLARAIELARAFAAPRIRCFDFWRLADPRPYRAEMNRKLLAAAAACGRHDLTLVLENETACNTATGAEAAVLLDALPSPHFMLVWDPANAAMAGETAFPDGYQRLPRGRIGHVHCKDVTPKPGGGLTWAPVNEGRIGWAAQFRALMQDGYRGGVSLETHWRGAGTPEASSRHCWQGMLNAIRQAQSVQTASEGRP